MTEPDARGAPRYVIDGGRFSSLDGFYDEVSSVLVPGRSWGRNLDAFDELFDDGFGPEFFGLPEGGFTLVWRRPDLSRERLGHAETARQLKRWLRRCHPESVAHLRRRIEDARAGRGPTLFDEIVEIVRNHGPGGAYAKDGVLLVLE